MHEKNFVIISTRIHQERSVLYFMIRASVHRWKNTASFLQGRTYKIVAMTQIVPPHQQANAIDAITSMDLC
jgi:hypothetical protein